MIGNHSDLYRGTAEYYAHYRLPYPKELLDDLIERTKPNSFDTLLDLASGPGRIAIPLAGLFKNVIANDISAEMAEQGNYEAKKKNVYNIQWIVCRAEELEIEPNSVDLVTIGEAFHRLEQTVICNLIKKWLKPGGTAAMLGMYNIMRGKEKWQEIIREVIHKFSPNHSVFKDRGPENFMQVLQDNGFSQCIMHSFEFQHLWTPESITGFLYSTALCSKTALGANTSEFESALKTALKNAGENGQFIETVRCGYIIGKN